MHISIPATQMGSDFDAWRRESRRQISIPATQMGSDHMTKGKLPYTANFNPRRPNEQRLNPMAKIKIAKTISIPAAQMSSDRKT